MIFVKDLTSYAKVWKIDRKEKYTDVRISTSEKLEDGTYKNSNWFARAIGHAHNSFASVGEGDRIIITKCRFSNETYTAEDGTKKSSFKFVILECKKETDRETPQEQTSAPTTQQTSNTSDDIPW